MAVISVALEITTLVAATLFTVTLVAPVKLVPEIVIDVPPLVGPDVGLTDEMVGTGTATYVNAPSLVAVPPAVVTATLLAPAVPAGVFAVIVVALTTTTLVAATLLTVTLVAPVRLVPEIVIAVPPLVGPDVGLTVEMVGSATIGNSMM